MSTNIDVCIVGGGLAGLCLALQLRKENKNLEITVLEKREGKAPIAAHKVGESTVELGTYYLREVLGLDKYLDEFHLPKRGLRYFFSSDKKHNIAERLEIGARRKSLVPSHQIDRGIFENDLAAMLTQNHINYIDGAKVEYCKINKDKMHSIIYTKNNTKKSIDTKWLVDASGRDFLLKKQYDLVKETTHNINAVWWRYNGVIDIEEWSTNEKWQNELEAGIRKLGTIHLMDKGYWVWIIPLASGKTSIGIVADPAEHPLHTYNSYDKAMQWLKENEAHAFEAFKDKKFEVLDFKALKNYAHNSKQFYSKDRWAIAGEAGAFLDPFYSPGTDFIALSNTWISNLIKRDYNNEDINMPARLFEITHSALLENWIPIYNNKYKLFGSSQIMLFKIFWDWTVYWGIPAICFVNNAYIDLASLKILFAKANSPIPKFAILSKNMQNFFLDWLAYDNTNISKQYVDFIDMVFFKELHFNIDKKMTQKELYMQINENLKLIEQVATCIYQIVSKDIFDLDNYLNIDPYHFNLKEGKDTLVKKSKENDREYLVPENIKEDILKVWFVNKK